MFQLMKSKKGFIQALLVLILVVLLAIYFLARQGMPAYIKSVTRVERYRNETLYMDADLVQELNTFFVENENNEFGVCLEGNDTHFTGYHSYTVGTETEVTRRCYPSDTVCSMHSHPPQNLSCSLSYKDAITHYMSKVKYTMIMCGPSKFRVFDSTDYYKSYRVEVT